MTSHKELISIFFLTKNNSLKLRHWSLSLKYLISKCMHTYFNSIKSCQSIEWISVVLEIRLNLFQVDCQFF
jgi:hypothetical protein